jgi:hypothetical protein
MQEIREFDVAVDGVVVNSFDELEHGSCELLAAAKNGKTVVAVGPVSLCRRSPDLDPLAMTDDDARRVMEWLDTKETRSVVYVSFGSRVHATGAGHAAGHGTGIVPLACPLGPQGRQLLPRRRQEVVG